MVDIAHQKLLAITVRPSTQVVFSDATGRDIAAIVINDKHPHIARLVFKVSADIKIRRENAT